MIIEGKNSVIEAIKSGITVNRLYVDKNIKDKFSNSIIDSARERGIRVDFVDRRVLDSKAKTKNNQGFVADVTEFEYVDVDEILEVAKERGEDNFILILDGVEDPHNFGAIIRCAECAGVHGIIIPKNRACPVNETVVKTSAGAISNMKISRVTNINQTIDYLKDKNVWIFACEVGGEDIFKSNLKGNIAIVMGGEGKGVSRLTLEKCDETISLPLKGQVNSLNVSVACGIALYEAIRMR